MPTDSLSDRIIADLFGRPRSQFADSILLKRLTDEARKLHQQGMGPADIAARLRCSTNMVSGWLASRKG